MHDVIEPWMLVINKICTFKELNTFWSYDDVMDAAAMLEFKAMYDSKINKIMEKGN